MKKIYLLLLGALLAFGVSAQQGEIRGIITDAESHAPLPSAIIWISSESATTTDKNGGFTLPCSGDSATVTISFLGYETEIRRVACGQDLQVSMQVAAKNLNTIEITATSSQNKAMLYQPASIARLGEAEIKRGQGLLLDDAINTNIPGVFMSRRTFSAGQQFNIRGYGNGARGTNGVNSNFDGQGYKVYLNGIPITDAEGITLMDDIDFGSVGNVELVKGPSGTLYGQAIAGVVNLKTAKPEPGHSKISQDVLLGSYGLQRYTTSLQVSKERTSILANYGKQLYDGFMPHTQSDKDFFNFIGEFTPNQKQSIITYVGYSNSYDQRNGEITREQWAAGDYSGNPAYIKNDAHSNVMTFRAGVGHTYDFSEKVSNTTTLFGTGLSSNVSSAGGWTDKSSVNYGLRTTFDTRFSIGDRMTLTGITGGELQQQNAQILSYPMVVDSFDPTGYNIIGTLRSNQYIITSTASAFTEWTLSLASDLSVTAGFGWSGLGIELNDRFYVASNNNPSNPNGTQKPSKYTNAFNDMFSPHLAVNKVFNKHVSAYVSYSDGYKAPVSSYFYVPVTGEVLTDLVPEHATQYEAGTKGTILHDKLNYQLAAFYTQYKDKMTTIAVPNETNTATSYVYVANAGEQNHFGVELALRGTAYTSDGFISNLTPFINLAYSDFNYGDFKYQQLSADKKSVVEVDYTDNVVVGVPPLVFNAGLDLNTSMGLYANITFSYRDKMYFTSDNLNEADPYELLNAKLGYSHSLGKHFGLDAYFGFNNITSNQNYAMVFLNQLPDAYLPAPDEINYYGGVKLSYNF